MLFLIDENKKVIFGWSAKCGCSHIKNIFYYLQTGEYCKPGQIVHRGKGKDFKQLPENLNDYTIIMFIRNPFERVVSGFLDKYKLGGEFRDLWDKTIPLTFSNFVDKIIENNRMIDNHHFTPQTSEHFCDKVRYNNKTFIYDINNINYDFIEHIYGKKIPKEVLDYRGEHCYNYIKTIQENEINIYDIELDTYHGLKIPLKYYYNVNIQHKIEKIYKEDLIFFEERGFIYTFGGAPKNLQ
jgi:hypothetical protein